MRDGETSGQPRAAPGTRLNGIYEIERLVATGGMGEIYKGRAIQTGDAVAIKMIRADLAERQDALALFRKEAAALHNLHHAAIVRYFVFSIDPVVGCPYLAMEFVEGRSLSEILSRGPLSFDSTLILLRRLASGLQAAHDLGIVHRDVSPDNIILPNDDVSRAKIIDFGIARSTTGDVTVIGSGFAGKFRYVSPEQLGLQDGEVGPKSDIYSLGLVIAQALLGYPLDMGGTQVQVLEKRRAVPDLSSIDARIRPLLKRMLQPDPGKRPASMSEIAAWSIGSTAPSRAPKSQGRKRRLIPAVLGLGVLAIGGAFFAAWQFLPLLSPDLSAPPEQERKPEPELVPKELSPAPPDLREQPWAPPTVPLPRPEAPPPQPEPPPDRARRSVDTITRFVRDYSGGECFFVSPLQVTESAAAIEAYGASPAPFKVFDEAFRQANGFEAQIALRKVSQAQCPVVSFLSRLRDHRGPVPRMRVEADVIRSGQFLTGAVDAVGQSNVDLLLVSDDGAVHNLASATKRTGNTLAFRLKVENSLAGGAARPSVLIALTSARPLALFSSRTPLNAQQLFPRILEEVDRGGQLIGVTAKYVKIEG